MARSTWAAGSTDTAVGGWSVAKSTVRDLYEELALTMAALGDIT